MLFSGIGAVELSAMLEKKQLYIHKIEAFILGALAPAVLTFSQSFNFPQWIVQAFIMAGAIWVLISRVFSPPEKMETVTNSIAAGFTVLVYPGLFMYWLVKMACWENTGIVMLIFLLIIFGTDAAAWLSGTLFGKNNRGIIPASPNKSIAGFTGGVIGSIIVSCGAALIVPAVFISSLDFLPVIFMAILLGIFTGIAAMLGDLAESAIKRSCGFKDSGKLMFGRGGILDSIDSIAVASPVFYLLYNIFFIN
jgi:phosphatidate cytidylyltransferase